MVYIRLYPDFLRFGRVAFSPHREYPRECPWNLDISSEFQPCHRFADIPPQCDVYFTDHLVLVVNHANTIDSATPHLFTRDIDSVHGVWNSDRDMKHAVERAVTIRPRLTLVDMPWGLLGHANPAYYIKPPGWSTPRGEFSPSWIITPAYINLHTTLSPSCLPLTKLPSGGHPSSSYDGNLQRCPSAASQSTPMIHGAHSQARPLPPRPPPQNLPHAQSKSAPRSNASTNDR